MNLFYSLLIAGALITASLQALLPPLYESTKELQAILASPELGQKLTSGDVIEKIERTSDGFLITTNKRTLLVIVTYEATGRIGPASDKLTFGDPVPLPTQVLNAK